jgi:peptidoglycan hydrolase-like protein with peptidoglycan-binding domain
MTNSSRLAATALAAALAIAPAAAFAASGGVGPSDSQSMSGSSAPAGMPATGGATSAPMPSDSATTGDAGRTPRLSPTALQGAQQQLQQQGYYTNAQIDGRWGPQTRKAVQSFQQAKGLPVTGHLDQQTLGALGVNGQGG